MNPWTDELRHEWPRHCGREMVRVGRVTAESRTPPGEVESVQYVCARCGLALAEPLRHRSVTSALRTGVAV